MALDLRVIRYKQYSQFNHPQTSKQYYHDLWARQSKMLAPLTSLVGECSQTKVTRAKGPKKMPWHWDEVHQRPFDHIQATIAREVVLATQTIKKSLRFTLTLQANS
jgi:hypothetical protein